MAWTAPSTQITGAPITATLWNIEVVNDRDNHYNLIQYGGGSESTNLAIGAGNNLTFDTDLSGYDGYRDGSNDDRVYAVKTGLHEFFGILQFNGATTLTLQVDGTNQFVFGSYQRFWQTHLLYMTAGEYVTMKSSAGVTMTQNSYMGLKLVSGGWTDYGHWTDI